MDEEQVKSDVDGKCASCGNAWAACACLQSRPDRSALEADGWVGSTIQGYEITALLGKGGMGVVYRARDTRLAVWRAIKVLTRFSSQSFQRFLTEARYVSSLSHPNIIAFHDFGQGPGGIPFVVMDFLEGQTLADLIDSGEPLTLEQILEIVLQICSGLEHAHAKGILHRDIKPSNLMLVKDESGRELVKILDFGIARGIGNEKEGSHLTKTGEIIGSPSYMSPEQAQGHEVDERSDIYSFGCVVYELLKGDVLFKGESTVKVILNHIFQTPPPLTERLGAKIPPALTNLVSRCLEKNPEDRYLSVSQIRQEVEKIKAGDPVDNLQIARKTKKLAQKLKRRLPGLLIGGMAFTALGAAYFAWDRTVQSHLLQVGNAEFYVRRSWANRDARNYAQAVADAGKAIQLKPSLALAYQARADGYWLDGKPEQAISDYTKALQLDPANIQLYKSRAAASSFQGRFQDTIDDCSKAIGLNFHDPQPYMQRAWANLMLGQKQKAVDDYSALLKLDPGNSQAYSSRGTAYCEMGDFHKAIGDLSKSVQLNPKDAAALNARAWSYCQTSDYRQAIDDAGRAIALDAKMAPAYDTRGFALYKLGRFESALNDLTKAVQLDGKAGIVFFHRSQTYEKLGKKQLAAQDAETAARLGYKQDRTF